MRTRFAALVGALLVPFLLRGVASAEDAAQKVVTDKEHDFAWTLPSAWEVVEPSASDRESGYHAKAKRPVSAGVECTANVFVKPAGGWGFFCEEESGLPVSSVAAISSISISRRWWPLAIA